MENHGLKEALEKTLDVFNKQSKDNYMGEENVKIKLVLPILEKLGWNIIDDIDFEHSVCKGSRVDCCFGKGGRWLFIEVKAYKKDKTEAEKIEDISQLRNYCVNGNVRYGMLTDGINWEIYGPFDQKASYYLSKNEIDIRENERIENFKYLYFKNKENLIGDGLFDIEKIKRIIDFKEIASIISNRIKNEVLAKNPDANIADDLIDYDRYAKIFRLKIVEKDKELSDCIDATYKEVIGDGAKDRIINVLSEWLKYEAFAKYSNINIEDKLFKEHIEKIYPPHSLGNTDEMVKVEVFKVFKETLEKNIGSDYVTINSENEIKVHRNCDGDVIKGFVLSFLEKLGWETTCIEKENQSKFLLKGVDNKHFLLLLVKGLNKKNNDLEELDTKKYKKNIRYIVVTNGIKWKFYGPFEKEPQDFSVNLYENNISQVADFLSMLSKDNIEELHCKVVGTRILDCILEEERNSELKREVIEASVSMDKEKIDMLAKKLHYKALAMNPKIEVPEEYLKDYIRWYGTENVEKEDENANESGNFEVTFPGCKPINRKEAKQTYVEVIKKIINEKGLDNVVKCKGRGGRELVYKGCKKDEYDEPYNEEYYIACHIGNGYKEQCLKDISECFSLKLEIKRF